MPGAENLGSVWLELPQRPPVPETGAHLNRAPHECSRLESNQHLLRFRQAPSPDRLREQNRGRVTCPATGIVDYLIFKESFPAVAGIVVGHGGIEPPSLG